jgi:hypothetical protein
MEKIIHKDGTIHINNHPIKIRVSVPKMICDRASQMAHEI